jgi:hypothetical protein
MWCFKRPGRRPNSELWQHRARWHPLTSQAPMTRGPRTKLRSSGTIASVACSFESVVFLRRWPGRLKHHTPPCGGIPYTKQQCVGTYVMHVNFGRNVTYMLSKQLCFSYNISNEYRLRQKRLRGLEGWVVGVGWCTWSPSALSVTPFQ